MTLELTTVKNLREIVAAWRAAGDSVALVPTMGALHAGHMALVKAARVKAKRVVVSIFVNPTQFGPHEDFDRYPRPLAQDVALLRLEKVDAAWLPTVEEMYPAGFATNMHVSGISEGLDGAHRPGHFDGVATVVAKLLLQVMPDMALFGEKDYQQLCVIKRLVRDLGINTSVLGVTTVRDADGLALSSRNMYLTKQERLVAPTLYQTLMALAAQLRKNRDDRVERLIEHAKAELIAAGFASIDYLALCNGTSLVPLAHYQSHSRLLVAARLGTTRLIDNIEVE